MTAPQGEQVLRRSAVGIDGLPVIVSPILPTYPSHGEDARRMVRHGMADVLAWLGETVGPKPGAPTHAFVINGRVYASQEWIDRLFRPEGSDRG